MATLCKNCASPLVFDPLSQKVVCKNCGSAWDAEEVESEEKKYKTEQPIAMEDIMGVDDSLKNEFFDCYVYTCSSCGGEININGSEVSTKCIYCGSSSVVFSRISKEKAPEFIIPFSVSKEQAVDSIKARFKRGLFIPKEIKDFQPTDVRGIYIPFWLVNAYHVQADVLSSEVQSGKYSHTNYYKRSGKMAVSNLPVDGSLMLSDESSQRLEPFDISELKLFDEDYLLGFYSNVSDIRVGDLREAVEKRVSEAFREQEFQELPGTNKKTKLSSSRTLIDQDLRYVFMPVWFVTYNYEGKHNTIMVNGQTGKVVCGVPWNEKAFKSLVAGLAAVFAFFTTIFYRYAILPTFISLMRSHSRNSGKSSGTLITMVIFGVCGIFGYGVSLYKKVKKQLKLSQADSIFNFVKKRQG
ncbi:MAG: hypothetical protein IKG93_08365 [Clostridiales bacterium]|nr:hypothetical protein [Clostridiales bacterium]